jgi:short-subunit dehydrogenase involved in D-alanine esterification of teichoic acids
MKRFEGKTALVTGGNSGIGLATPLAFAGEGARVVITGRDQATLDQAKSRLGPGAIAIRNDAGQAGSGAALAETLKANGVKLDAVFVDGGMSQLRP